jgi:peptidyl-prolyl cis-trans isomerase D
MLSFVRKAARSWVAGVLIGLLVISFTIWGINDVFKGTSKDNVAIVAGKTISAADFKREFDQVLKRAGKESGQAVSTQEAIAQGADTSTLERMIGEKSFSWFFDKLGLRVASEIVQSEIKKINAFIDPTTKQFSDFAYQQTLQDNGLTPQSFEQNIKTDMARRLLVLAGTSGFRAPQTYAVQTLAFGTERRTITMIPVAAKLAGTPPVPNDAQINALYEEVKPRIMQPELRDFTIIIAKSDKFIANAKIDPAQIKQVFDAQKDKLATPATRTFVQIVAKDEASANEAAKRLKAGETPEAIAKALNLQAPLNFKDADSGKIPDQDVVKAVFAAKIGDIGAVKGALSHSAYKITGAKEQIAADFAKVQPEIQKALAKEAANQSLTDATNAYDDAISQGDNVEVAAKKAGFDIIKISGITKEGADPKTGKAVDLIATNKDALNQAFNLAQGDSTDLINAKDDGYLAIRADKIVASSPIPLAQIKNDLAKEWTARELGKSLKAKAEEIAKEAKANGIEAAAKKFGLNIIKPPKPLLRGQGSQELSAAIFSGKNGEIVTGPVANGVEYVVIRIDGIVRDDDTKTPDRLAKAEENIRQSVQQDLAQAIDVMARKRAKVKSYPERVKAIFAQASDTQVPAKK